MAARKLATYVHVDGQAYGPDDDVPADVAAKITNPAAWGEAVTASQDGPPPQSGRGSGTDAWVAYAASAGVDVPDDAGRDDIIAAVAAAGHPVE